MASKCGGSQNTEHIRYSNGSPLGFPQTFRFEQMAAIWSGFPMVWIWIITYATAQKRVKIH